MPTQKTNSTSPQERYKRLYHNIASDLIDEEPPRYWKAWNQYKVDQQQQLKRSDGKRRSVSRAGKLLKNNIRTK